MSNNEPKVIGEGTYGCVHRPSLTCKKLPKNETYRNKTSKMSSPYDAKKELKEYKNVSNADTNNNFYLGKPFKCDPEITASNYDAARKCKLADYSTFSLDQYKLIVMEDGGENLDTYCKKINTLDYTHELRNECQQFLLESLRLFKGLCEYKKEGLIHHDLKPQNIVYNKQTNRLNFIDFGLMTKKNDLLTLCEKNSSKYSFASKIHWSFPLEIQFMYKSEFNFHKSSSTQQHKKRFDDKLKNIRTNTGHNGQHISFLLKYMFNERRVEYPDNVNNLLDDYKEFLINGFDGLSYEHFAELCADTIDSYGLGFTMAYWLWSVRKHLQESNLIIYEKLRSLFYSMSTPNVNARIRIESAASQLENIISESGLLDKYDKKIVAGIVVDKSVFVSEINKPVNIKLKKLKKPIVINLEPDACPEGKERNPKTGRCVNLCKEGYYRNEDFKCIKQKVEKPKAVKSEECPENKEKNPKTGRCVKKCKEGLSRDKDFKCKSEKRKTLKNK